jgi:hypothetical protein
VGGFPTLSYVFSFQLSEEETIFLILLHLAAHVFILASDASLLKAGVASLFDFVVPGLSNVG